MFFRKQATLNCVTVVTVSMMLINALNLILNLQLLFKNYKLYHPLSYDLTSRTHARTHTRTHTHRHTHICTHTHTCTHIYMYTELVHVCTCDTTAAKFKWNIVNWASSPNFPVPQYGNNLIPHIINSLYFTVKIWPSLHIIISCKLHNCMWWLYLWINNCYLHS